MTRTLPLAALAWMLLAGRPASTTGQEERWALRDPEDVVTAEACGECHLLEHEVWEDTRHQTSFRTLHRLDNAAAIAERMDIRLMKRDSLCLRCHYTPLEEDGELRAVSGVSCESCHGAGRGWIDIHNDYGPGADASTETAEHRRTRIERSRQAGMGRPSDILGAASACFECHTVPEERLVNVGGHSTGSASFELVEWTQGSIRHNFLGSLRGGDQTNRPSSTERRRLLYLAGRMLDLEYSLRGMARASDDGLYAKAMARRVRAALAEVLTIDQVADLPALGELAREVRAVRVAPGRADELTALADRVRTRTASLLEGRDGADLAALDPLVRGESPPVRITEAPEPGEATRPDAATAGPGAGPDTGPGDAPGGGATVGATGLDDRRPSTLVTAVDRPTTGVVGTVRRRLRPPADHDVVGPGACSGCHAEQNAWWFDDTHFASAERFFLQDPAALRIARLYGVAPARMTVGSELCMDCHGSVVSGRESRQVLDGVGCEGCHGAAADWLEPHKEGDAAMGRRRPGFIAALERGKRDLADLDVRAGACADCHYITDPRLISSGHPTGADFDLATAMEPTRHWDGPSAAPAELRTAWTRGIRGRGPIPAVAVATLADADTAAAGTGPSPSTGPSPPSRVTGSGSAGQPSASAPLQRPRPQPEWARAAPVRPEGAPPEGLPPFPEIDPRAPVEEILRTLAERLERLYAYAAGKGGAP